MTWGTWRSIGSRKLGRDRAGFWAVTINGPMHWCFRRAGDAVDVEIVDYH